MCEQMHYAGTRVINIVPAVLIDEVNEIKEYEKETIKYIDKNYDKVRNIVKAMAWDLGEFDVNDIVSDVIEYFANGCDYDIEKATKKDGSGVISIEAYIYKIIKFSIKRKRHDKKALNNREQLTLNVREGAENDGREVIDGIKDEHGEDMFNKVIHARLEEVIKDALYVRNRVRSIDLFEIIYIKLSAKNQEDVDLMLQVMGHTKKEIEESRSLLGRIEEVRELIHVLAHTPLNEAIEEIGKWVYCRKDIDNVIHG